MRPRAPLDRAKAFANFRTDMLEPVIGLERGLTDPITNLGMGQTAEVLAHIFKISRQQADEYSTESHHRLAKAQQEGWLNDEVEPMFARDGELLRSRRRRARR